MLESVSQIRGINAGQSIKHQEQIHPFNPREGGTGGGLTGWLNSEARWSMLRISSPGAKSSWKNVREENILSIIPSKHSHSTCSLERKQLSDNFYFSSSAIVRSTFKFIKQICRNKLYSKVKETQQTCKSILYLWRAAFLCEHKSITCDL